MPSQWEDTGDSPARRFCVAISLCPVTYIRSLPMAVSLPGENVARCPSHRALLGTGGPCFQERVWGSGAHRVLFFLHQSDWVIIELFFLSSPTWVKMAQFTTLPQTWAHVKTFLGPVLGPGGGSC